MTSTMRAVAIDAFGPADELRLRTLRRPTPSAGEALVRVRAAGVQVTDAAIRSGWSPPGVQIEFPQVLGNEFAGVVAAFGADNARGGFDIGDEVIGFRMLGSYAEYVTVPLTQLVPKPPQMPWTEAGALSASGQTAHTALEALSLTAGESVLVHGAAGGVGTAFTQLAVAAGVRVVGTASRANHEHVRILGGEVVEYGDGQEERLRSLAPSGFDAAFDTAGHGNLRVSTALVADRARIATIVDAELAERLGCRFLRSDRSRQRLRLLADAVDAGHLRVHVRRAYDLANAAAAHRDVETGHGRGKVVLSVDGHTEMEVKP